MGERRGADRVLVVTLRERGDLESLDRRIILKGILKNLDGRAWTGSIWLRM